MEVVSDVIDNTLYVNLSGELDECSSNYFKQKIDDCIIKNNYRKVIFDLLELTFMDSTGIGVLIGRYKLLKKKSVPMFIVNPNKQIDKIFNISGLYQIMPKLS